MLKQLMGAGDRLQSAAYHTVLYAGILRLLKLTRQKVIRFQYFNGIAAIGLQLKKMT